MLKRKSWTHTSKKRVNLKPNMTIPKQMKAPSLHCCLQELQ